MIAEVISGQMTYINTNQGKIQIVGLADGKLIELHVNDKTHHPEWERLIGSKVEAIVIDHMVREVYEIEDE